MCVYICILLFAGEAPTFPWCWIWVRSALWSLWIVGWTLLVSGWLRSTCSRAVESSHASSSETQRSTRRPCMLSSLWVTLLQHYRELLYRQAMHLRTHVHVLLTWDIEMIFNVCVQCIFFFFHIINCFSFVYLYVWQWWRKCILCIFSLARKFQWTLLIQGTWTSPVLGPKTDTRPFCQVSIPHRNPKLV